MATGIALSHLGFQAALLLGPVVGGLAAAGWGVAACYLIDAAAGGAALYGVARLPPIPPAQQRSRTTIGALLARWTFVVRRPVLRGAFLSDLAATLLAMPIALFPVINQERFDGDPRTLGLFLSAIAVGGVLAGVTSGAVTRCHRPGWVMLAAAAGWGVSLAGFGLAGPLWLALACLVVAGGADTISVVSRGTIVQLATADSHRGRVTATENVVGAAGPDLGNLRAGTVADLTSATTALVSGGLLCVLAVVAVAAGHARLRRFRRLGIAWADST